MVFQNLGCTYTWSDETAQEIETVWENSDSALSQRPLTTALFPNKQLYFPKKSDIILQKDLELLPAIRIKRQW